MTIFTIPKKLNRRYIEYEKVQTSFLNHCSQKKKMENQSASEALYEFPALSVNQFGWGPSSIPDQFGDLPFSLFSRDDNLGMIVELTGPNFAQKHCILYSIFFSCFSIFR